MNGTASREGTPEGRGRTSEVLGTCHHDCPDSCGWRVTVVDGAAVKLRGNPEHPYSQGELCPKVNRFLSRVYAPDRLLNPLIRTGAKGEGKFRQASWDEALELTASRLAAIRDSVGGEAILPWSSAGTQGTIQHSSLDRRLFHHLGASTTVGSVCGAVAAAGFASTYGAPLGADPLELVHAQLVVLWGTNTRLTNRHLWPYVETARERGAEIVVVDPFRTVTAGEADWFIQPLPGTDAALIMAMVHVIVRDDLVDHDYVTRYTDGFEQLAERAATWTPVRAGAVCGLDPEVIERFAHRYATATPAFIRTLIGAEHHRNGARFFRTLGCLPLITGSWRHRGGGLARSVGAWATTAVNSSVFDPEPDGRPPRRAIPSARLGAALTDATLGIRALVVWGGNPVVTLPNAGAVRRGLQRDDLFTVVSEQFMTDTARFADVVFPATTQIEQFDVVEAWGHLYLGWNESAIAPLGEAVPNTELWRRLAGALGIEDPLFELSDLELIERCVTGVDCAELRRRGVLRVPVDEPLRPYVDGGFVTSSGRAQLWSGDLDPLGERVPDVQLDVTDDGPYVLLTPKFHARFLNSSYSHHHGHLETRPRLQLDPADAAALGVADGDVVDVSNSRGSLRVPCEITHRLRPGVVAIPWGWWGEEAAVNVLADDTESDWGDGVAYGDTRVRLSTVGG